MQKIYADFRSMLCFFKYTKSNEIAAGVIPEMRDALPKVSGRASVNFAITSLDNPEICE